METAYYDPECNEIFTVDDSRVTGVLDFWFFSSGRLCVNSFMGTFEEWKKITTLKKIVKLGEV